MISLSPKLYGSIKFIFIVEASIQNGMRKPHPAISYDTLLKLGTDACLCIYIGNNYTDD